MGWKKKEKKRTYGTPKNLYISLFLLTIFGLIYYVRIYFPIFTNNIWSYLLRAVPRNKYIPGITYVKWRVWRVIVPGSDSPRGSQVLGLGLLRRLNFSEQPLTIGASLRMYKPRNLAVSACSGDDDRFIPYHCLALYAPLPGTTPPGNVKTVWY